MVGHRGRSYNRDQLFFWQHGRQCFLLYCTVTSSSSPFMQCCCLTTSEAGEKRQLAVPPPLPQCSHPAFSICSIAATKPSRPERFMLGWLTPPSILNKWGFFKSQTWTVPQICGEIFLLASMHEFIYLKMGSYWTIYRDDEKLHIVCLCFLKESHLNRKAPPWLMVILS